MVTKNGDRGHTVIFGWVGYKVSNCSPGNKKLPGLTPRPHIAAPQAAGQAILE